MCTFKVFQRGHILDILPICRQDYSEKLAARTAVNKYFDNEQTHTNESARKELVHFKQRQRKKE